MYVVLQETFRRRVQEELDDLAWSQSELARKLGVTPAYVNQYLKGRSCPGLDVVERFANALGYTEPLDFLNGKRPARKNLEPVA